MRAFIFNCLIAMAALFILLAYGPEPQTDSVTLEIVFPEKKSDRAQPYWFIAARGYAI